MENRFINNFRKSVSVRVKGKSINRFIQRVVNNKIAILDLNYLSYNTINIKIYVEDYLKILKIKTIYDISIIDGYGMLKYKVLFKKNLLLIITIIIGFCLLFTLSNMVFKVEVVHNNRHLREILIEELADNGLKVGSFAKNYQEIKEIKNNILNKHKDTIEWLEIERVGTKYIVRVEQRIIPNKDNNNTKQHIISSKYAIIKKIVASKGQIVKNINDYVAPGDIIISGNIELNGSVKDTVRAEGIVYGEVWYQTSIEYPLTYYEEKFTGDDANVLVLDIFNHKIELFKKYQYKYSEEKKLLSHNILPLEITIEHQREIKKIEDILTYEQAIDKAITLARDKIMANLTPDEEIISQKQLKVTLKNSKIIVDIFFTVYENITMHKDIEG